MNQACLEILVDRENEKGVFIAEQVLNILHDTIEKPRFPFGKDETPVFSFEIFEKKWKISFFLFCPKDFKNFVENQFYAHFPNIQIREIPDFLEKNTNIYEGEVQLKNLFYFPIKIYDDFNQRTEKEIIDPYSAITSALQKWAPGNKYIRITFKPVDDKKWKLESFVQIALGNMPRWLKNILTQYRYRFIRYFFKPLKALVFLLGLLIGKKSEESSSSSEWRWSEKEAAVRKKLEGYGFLSRIHVGYIWGSLIDTKMTLREISRSFTIFSIPGQNEFRLQKFQKTTHESIRKYMKISHGAILNAAELAGLIHLPTKYVQTPGINWSPSKILEPPHNLPLTKYDEGIVPVGVTNFRNQKEVFWLMPNDRRRHTYIIWKTGMGKSTLLENMIYDDISKWRWVAIVDPHGDLVENIVNNMPKSRTNDVILFDPSDTNHPIGFNMLESVIPELRPIVASGLVGIFKRMFAESWGPRLEYILRNTILSLLALPNTTLLSIPIALTDEGFRRKMVEKVDDDVLKRFWQNEFGKMRDQQRNEAISPILNKIGQFLSSYLIRNIVGQPKSGFSLRWAMDKKKIILVNLSKGKIGEDASNLLGAMMVTKFQIDAMSRANIPENERTDFYLYVDEFQNFATDSFATILSEARKYKLNLIMANQYIEQMSDSVRGAVFGNVGTTIGFQVGYHDAEILSKIFGEEIVSIADLVNIRRYSIYSNLLIDGMPSRVFSADTQPPILEMNDKEHQNREKIIKVSRDRYGKERKKVEATIKKNTPKMEIFDKKKKEAQNNKK